MNVLSARPGSGNQRQFGWELKLAVAGELQQSQVYRSQDEVFDTIESWKAAMA